MDGEPPRPLAFDAASTPSKIRIVNRARYYWLVTYLRSVNGTQRLFWGFIDWQEEEPQLREIRDAAALDEALAIVGFV